MATGNDKKGRPAKSLSGGNLNVAVDGEWMNSSQNAN